MLLTSEFVLSTAVRYSRHAPRFGGGYRELFNREALHIVGAPLPQHDCVNVLPVLNRGFCPPRSRTIIYVLKYNRSVTKFLFHVLCH